VIELKFQLQYKDMWNYSLNNHGIITIVSTFIMTLNY